MVVPVVIALITLIVAVRLVIVYAVVDIITVTLIIIIITFTAWKMSKYGVISGPYFSVFSPNTGKLGREITPYLDTFHAVIILIIIVIPVVVVIIIIIIIIILRYCYCCYCYIDSKSTFFSQNIVSHTLYETHSSFVFCVLVAWLVHGPVDWTACAIYWLSDWMDCHHKASHAPYTN